MTPVGLPAISVVVCTRDRPQLLQQCLAALQQLDYPAFEVLVVDNAPATDNSRELVRATPFRYLREDRPGLDWARNCGLRAATHGIVAFTDDDVRVDPAWLRGIASGFAVPEVAAVTGLVLPLELQTPAQRLYEQYGTGMSRGSVPRRFVAAALTPAGLIGTQEIGVGANMAFRQAFLVQLGGFDTALDAGTPAGGAGDLDIFHRILCAGGVIAYEPSAVVRHRHRPEMDALRRQLGDNGRSFGVYLIRIWQARTVRRRDLARYALGTWFPWLFGRLLRGLAGHHPLPVGLLWAELVGTLCAPFAYRASLRQDERIRRGS